MMSPTSRCVLSILLATVACGGDKPIVPPVDAGLNLRPALVYMVQAVQNQAGDVPMVAAREAMLRVFVTASESTTVSPTVRVRLFSGTTVIRTDTLRATRAGVPTAIDEGHLDRSWNLRIPKELVQTGLGVAVDVDPGNAITESSETDNSWPATGSRTVSVRVVQAAQIVVVPVITGGVEGDPRVTLANALQITDLARKLFPHPTLTTQLHAAYTTDAFLEATDVFEAWPELLSELVAMRAAEGSTAEYLGIVRQETTPELLGLGGREHVAISHDDLASPEAGIAADTVAAHELGHVWGLRHAPCGGAAFPETYPYPGGVTGTYGIDLETNVVMPSNKHDIMGYCSSVWISDFMFRKVMNNRAPVAGARVPSLIVWGRIRKGVLIVEPPFRAVTMPKLPPEPGRFSVRGFDEGGRELFALLFEGSAVEGGRNEDAVFAFAVPIAAGVEVAELRFAGPRGGSSRRVRRDGVRLERRSGAIVRIVRERAGPSLRSGR